MTHTLTLLYQSPSGTLQGAMVITGDNSLEASLALPADSSQHEIDVSFTLTTVVGCVLSCDQNCTLKTNSSGAPQDTITLTAGIPKTFVASSIFAAMFANNVTKFFVQNTSSPLTAGTFQFRAMLNL